MGRIAIGFGAIMRIRLLAVEVLVEEAALPDTAQFVVEDECLLGGGAFTGAGLEDAAAEELDEGCAAETGEATAVVKPEGRTPGGRMNWI